MSVLEWPHHLLTLDDWADLPAHPEMRVEVVEGVLSVSPRPMSLHQLIISRLPYLLTMQLPPELVAVGEFETVLAAVPPTVRVPDVVVAPSDLIEANIPRIGADDVSLVVEVLSPATKDVDQGAKLFEYADAGIEDYWIVDVDPPASMIAYRLIDGDYENFGEYSGAVELEVAGVPVKFDLNSLIDPRAQR